jgi:hypothetical protein
VQWTKYGAKVKDICSIISGVGKRNCLQAKVNVWDDYRLDITYYVKYPLPTLLAKYPITVIISDFYSMLIFFIPFSKRMWVLSVPVILTFFT